MSKRYWKMMAACAFATSLSVPLVAQDKASPKSATVARDVNGFRLGMTVAEARSLAPLTFIGGDQFEAATDGFVYNFGVTPRGRIYRVQSTQQLGRFVVDEQFLTSLGRRLAEKYGEPNRRSGDVFHWALVEPVSDASGQTLPFTTMWMSAYVGGFGGNPTLEISIVDFRILWADRAIVNREPRESAKDRVQF